MHTTETEPDADALAVRMPALVAAGSVYLWSSGVTDWYRDPDLWPPLLDVLASRPDPLVWSVGCATGEEPYTLAMLTAEWANRPRIVATDVRRDALDVARAGRYPAPSCRPPWCPAGMVRRFTYRDGWATVRPSIRRRVAFLAQDIAGPVPRVADLILMRNVLHMLDRAEVPRALATVWTSLAPGGRLIVGRSDLLVPRLAAALPEWGSPAEHELIWQPART